MRKKADTLIELPVGEPFPIGAKVLLVRPHLWSGTVGVVESVSDFVHVVRIAGLHGEEFSTVALPQALRWWPWLAYPHRPAPKD